jgi:hypothetical protein
MGSVRVRVTAKDTSVTSDVGEEGYVVDGMLTVYKLYRN